MYVAALWRYPVKSLAGERLEVAELGPAGIPGDRSVQVYDARDRVVTARTRPRLLALRASLDAGGDLLVEGRPWTASEVGAAIVEAAGAGARLVRNERLDRFDVLPLLVATDGAIAALGVDGRRLRPNIVIGDVAGLSEREWPGRRLRIGAAVVQLAELRQRCVMTTYDPDTQSQDPTVLRRIVKEFGGRMALDASVVARGLVRVGDPGDPRLTRRYHALPLARDGATASRERITLEPGVPDAGAGP